MLQQILTAIPLETATPWLVILGFGAYHGLNPGMGWLFALSNGLQRRSERAIWTSLLPIAAGHAASLAAVAALVLLGASFISPQTLEVVTALVLLGFGLYKVLNYYRHPRWVGMKVSMRDMAWWSFLMAIAHGAGLMIAPALLTVALPPGAHEHHLTFGSVNASAGILLHTLSMLLVMAVVALVVYRRVGLAILRQRWVNFDLIWAIALLLVGGAALLNSVGVVQVAYWQ